MTEDRYTRAATAAATHLAWLTTAPHRLDQIIDLYAEQVGQQGRPISRVRLSNEELIAKIAGSTDGGVSTGGHSDPTGDAATAGAVRLSDEADDMIAAVTVNVHAAAVDAVTLADLARCGGVAIDARKPRKRRDQIDFTATTLARIQPHLDTIVDCLPPLEQSELLQAIEHLADVATWLRVKLEGIWSDLHGEKAPEARQKALRHCACCWDWGYREYAVEGSDLCAKCETFRRQYKCWPTLAIKRELIDYSKKRLTQQLIDDARAAARKRTG